ncbi:MAG: zinc-ribbon domain-containing protein [Promethearchaeota archaeon]|nr:MAG: zinc-ribbon domain-containing protein [Candidatus Lokiarchaeota archaeon]
MIWNEIKKKISMGTIGLWVLFIITTFVMIILAAGVFYSFEFWMPIPIGVVLIFAIIGTIIDFYSKRKVRFGMIGFWTLFAITTLVMFILQIAVFPPYEYWIPLIPIGSTLILAIFFTILEYTANEVKFCSKCGKQIDGKWEFCQECGTRVLIICPSCGTKVKGNPKFCHICGINLSEIKLIQTSRTHVKYKVEGHNNFCQQCGAPSESGAKYCVYCGTPQ